MQGCIKYSCWGLICLMYFCIIKRGLDCKHQSESEVLMDDKHGCPEPLLLFPTKKQPNFKKHFYWYLLEITAHHWAWYSGEVFLTKHRQRCVHGVQADETCCHGTWLWVDMKYNCCSCYITCSCPWHCCDPSFRPWSSVLKMSSEWWMRRS